MTDTQTKQTARARVYDALTEHGWTNITVEENQTAVRGNPVSGKSATYHGLTKMSATGYEGVALTVWFTESDAFRFRDMKRAGSNFAGYAMTLADLLDAITTSYSPKYQGERAEALRQRLAQEQADRIAAQDRANRLDAAVRERVLGRLEDRLEHKLDLLFDLAGADANRLAGSKKWLAHHLAVDVLSSDVLCDDVVLMFEGEEHRVTSSRVVKAMFTRTA